MSLSSTTKKLGLECAIQIAANANLEDGEDSMSEEGEDVIVAPRRLLLL